MEMCVTKGERPNAHRRQVDLMGDPSLMSLQLRGKDLATQRAMLAPGADCLATQLSALRPVQARRRGPTGPSGGSVQMRAASGRRPTRPTMPFDWDTHEPGLAPVGAGEDDTVREVAHARRDDLIRRELGMANAAEVTRRIDELRAGGSEREATELEQRLQDLRGDLAKFHKLIAVFEALSVRPIP